MLPGARIPKWFDHSSCESSISFRFSKKIPETAVCVVLGKLEKPSHSIRVRIRVLINGIDWTATVLHSRNCGSIETEHVWLSDLRVHIERNNPNIFKDGWNRVDISCVVCPEVGSSSTEKAIVKWYGIHVHRQESNMDDVLPKVSNPPIVQNATSKIFCKDKRRTLEYGVNLRQDGYPFRKRLRIF
ncbi:hypothetical protein L6164_006266 [Bauhinia variegata]|uniref:Uncharacterized protein n=1 Tax=Bauhinia variegata TaxID=167791 RepID=A0ACB9PTV0_BAUVA|nr:hypothetical protein L6164_006266 [Bauhinia variegata]